MNDVVYAVLKCGDEWKVVCERRRIGHFAKREEAFLAGAKLAVQAREAGHRVTLLTQDDCGQLLEVYPAEYGWDDSPIRPAVEPVPA